MDAIYQRLNTPSFILKINHQKWKPKIVGFQMNYSLSRLV